MSNSSDEYNGWTNKPTWLVKLWIDNDQGLQELWHERAQNAADEYALAQTLQEEFEADADAFTYNGTRLISGAHFFADLMSWALANVNWDEVAHALIEDAAEVQA